MAFGCVPVTTGQWLPNSEAGSSTLSPLAQPFVVVRNNPKLIPDTSGHPYRDRPDHFVQPTPSSAPVDVYHPPASMATELGRHQGGGFPSGGSDWPVRRTLSSNLVKAEPFYPQYGLRDSGASKPPPAGFGFNERSDYDCLDRNRTHWKIPFAGDCDWESGTGRRIPSWMEPKGLGTEGIRKHSDSRDNNALENSSWAEFPGKGRVSNYRPAIQRGDNADVSLPYDNIWQGNHVESYVMKGRDTGCMDWLDGSSIHLQTSRAASTNMLNTSVLSEDLSATAPVLQVNIADVSKESCGTLCASPSSYYTIATEPGFHKSEQNDHYVDTAYSYSNLSSPPLMKMNPLPSSTLQSRKFSAEPLEPHHGNSLYRRRVSVTIREPNLNSSVIGEKPGAEKSDKSHDMSASYRLPKSPRNENASGFESKVDDLKNFSHMKTEVGKTSPSVNGSTDINDSIHNSTTVDQFNNAVDSPCWKGASASRYSPLFDSDSAACANAAQKSEKLELTNLTATDSIQVSEGFEKQDGNLILKEFKDDGPSKESCLLLSGTSANSSSFTAQSSYGNGILNDCAATRPFLLDDESNMYQCVKGDVPNSSVFGVLDLENSAEHRASEIKLSNMPYCDTHFLVRSIYDLSALLSSCYNGESMLKKTDYDVLLMAKYNLEACLAKKSEPQKENFICQQKANFVGDTYGPIEECRKTLKQKIHAHDENCESNAYKRLWIEAEAALCSMKYQLQVVRTSAGLINDTKLMEQDLQDSSDSGESPVQMMKTSLSMESPVKMMKSSLSTPACDFIGASHTPTVTHEGLGNHYIDLWGNPDGCNVKPHVQSDTSKDFEASVMARFNVLRSRDSKISTMSNQKQNKPEGLVASETNLNTNQMDSIFSDSQFTAGVRSFIWPSESTSAKSSQPLGFTSKVRSPEGKRGLLSSVNANHGDQVGEVNRTIFEAQVFPQEARLASRTENIIESYIPDTGPWRAQLTGKLSTAGSSDWEHVLKDDVTR